MNPSTLSDVGWMKWKRFRFLKPDHLVFHLRRNWNFEGLRD